MGKITIEELLNQLQYGTKVTTDINSRLPNNKDTWSKIGSRDTFAELGVAVSELDSFLATWIEENPYSNI